MKDSNPNTTRISGRHDFIETPFKQYLEEAINNHRRGLEKISHSDLKTAARSTFRVSNFSHEKKNNNSFEAFHVKFVKIPKIKTRSDIGTKSDRSSLEKIKSKKHSILTEGNEALLPTIEFARIKKKHIVPKRLKFNWEEIESSLFKMNSESFVHKLEQVTRKYKNYLKE